MKFLSLKELLNSEISEPKWLVDGLLPAEGTSVLCARPKVGKSTLARNLSLAVAEGEEFLGRATEEGRVLYLAIEENEAELKRHYQDLGVTKSEKIFIHIGMLPKDIDHYLRWMLSTSKPSLVIVDPLFRCIRIQDSNDYIQVTRSLEYYSELARKYSCHIMFVHHARKGESNGMDSLLGSTALFGSVDTSIMMYDHGLTRAIESIQRYGRNITKSGLVFDPTMRKYSIGDITSECNTIDRIKNQIMNCISVSEYDLTQKEILDNIKGKKEMIISALNELSESDTSLLIRDGDGIKGQPYTYRARS